MIHALRLSFYRFVLDPSPVIRDENGTIVSTSTPKAQFSGLPGQPLLTLGLEPIHNWLVEPTKSTYDLDNLRFSDVKNGIAHAYFELEYLLLEGHCVDTTTGQPPRGLQFVLANNNVQRTTHDTIVMANLVSYSFIYSIKCAHLALLVPVISSIFKSFLKFYFKYYWNQLIDILFIRPRI